MIQKSTRSHFSGAVNYIAAGVSTKRHYLLLNWSYRSSLITVLNGVQKNAKRDPNGCNDHFVSLTDEGS